MASTTSKPGVIMVLDSVFPSNGGGGAEFQVKTIATYFRQQGVPVGIVVPMVSYGSQLARETVDGVGVQRISYPNARLLGGVVLLLRLAVMLVRQRNSYSVIHAHIAGKMAAMASVIGRMLGKTVVVKLTGYQELQHGILAEGSGGPVTIIVRWGIKRATRVHAISSRLRSRLLARGFRESQILALPNAVDTARFSPSSDIRSAQRAKLGVRDSTRIYAYTGRLAEEKGVDLLVAAWARGIPREADAQLWLVGSGASAAELAERIRRQSLESQVVMMGAIQGIEDLLRAADIFVLPSYSEGLSNALLEAMATGLPVVGTRVSGTEDFIVPGVNGFIVPPGDEVALAEALRQSLLLTSDQIQKQGLAARSGVLDTAGIESVCGKLADVYGFRLPGIADRVVDGRSN